MERLSLIDISMADGFLVPSPGEDSTPESFSGLFEDLVEDNFFQKQIELGFQLAESPLSPEQNQRLSDKYNMRKSLAWDNAFVTCEGVLNHEELANVNSSFMKTESSSLPIILEDVARSTETFSSVDTCSLENLELDLSPNIRPSIQKTLGTTGKANKLAHPGKKTVLEKGVARPLRSSMRAESASQNKNKSSVALERSVARSHHCEGREITIARMGAAGIGSSKLPYPQRNLPRETPTTMLNKKRSVPGNTEKRTTNTKDRPGNVVFQKSVGAPKKINGGPCGGTVKTPSPTPSSSSNSPDVRTKPRVKITTASRTSGSRTGTRNPAVSPNSLVNFSSTTSPSSSFDSITSGSSSSTIFGVKTLMDSLDACSPSSAFSEEDNTAYQQPARANRARSFNSNSSRLKCSKPSGLKMPTPKLGYFDAKKAPTCNTRILPKAQHFTSGCPQSQDTSATQL